jgi:hypothetical protein
VAMLPVRPMRYFLVDMAETVSLIISHSLTLHQL